MAAGRKTRLRVLRGYDATEGQHGPAAMHSLIRVFGRLNEAMTRLARQYDLTLPILKCYFA